MDDARSAMRLLTELIKARPTVLTELLGDDHVPDLANPTTDMIEGTCLLLRGAAPALSRNQWPSQLAELETAKSKLGPNPGVDYLVGTVDYYLGKFADAVKLWAPIMAGTDKFLQHKIAFYFGKATAKMAAAKPPGRPGS